MKESRFKRRPKRQAREVCPKKGKTIRAKPRPTAWARILKGTLP